MTCLLPCLALIFATPSLVAAAQAKVNDPVSTAPTAALPAGVVDEQWVKASAPFQRERQRLIGVADRVSGEGPYTTDWATLKQYTEPDWYKDAKFGIFVHWGVYSLPAFGDEWYPRKMYIEGSPENLHHVATYGPLTSFGYKDFVPQFKAEHYDPKGWARMFAASGARYVVPVFEHHDGFAMYDSGLSEWTAVKMGPRRDLMGELATAVRAEGMHLGASSHRIEHDWFLDGGRQQSSDVNDPANAAFYGPAHPRVNKGDDFAEDWTYASPAYLDDWLARSTEIVEKYHPDLIYFDWWIGHAAMRPYLARFAAYFYNQSLRRGTQGVLNYKLHAMEEGTGTLDIERGQMESTRTLFWQTDTSVSNKSWGYIEHDSFKSPAFVVRQLMDIVSKNGNLLLNVGPRADGSFPDEVQKVLADVGAWLRVNGEAVYGTRPWLVYGEGPTKVAGGQFHDTETVGYTSEDFRFTAKGAVVYATELSIPETRRALIRSFGGGAIAGGLHVVSVAMLGSNRPVAFHQDRDGLHLELPEVAEGVFTASFRILTAGADRGAQTATLNR